MYVCMYVCMYVSRVSDLNGVSLLYIMLQIHHSGREPSSYILYGLFFHDGDGQPRKMSYLGTQRRSLLKQPIRERH